MKEKQMKRNVIVRLLSLVAAGCLSAAPLFAQTPELNKMKYQRFRERFSHQFMYVSGDGMVQGSYLPMEALRRDAQGGQTAYWADGTWWQGHYVAMLATEYALLKREGDSAEASATIGELRQALRVYFRLDSIAESCWNGTSALNGFYLRDDVPQSLAASFGVQTVLSDYQRHCGNVSSTGNGPSQDQAWATCLGLALVLRLVDAPEAADVRNMAVEVARRMVQGMQFTDAKGKEHWQVMNPVNGLLVQKEGDIQWLKYAHGRAFEVLTGEPTGYGGCSAMVSRRTFKTIQNNFLIDKYGHFNWYGVLALSTLINEKGRQGDCLYDWLVDRTEAIARKRPDLQQPIMFPHFPLISLLLYPQQEPGSLLPASLYEQMLDAAPEGGAHCLVASDGTIVHSAAPWHSLSLFCPWHTKDEGEFNMLDYMLLYNLYRLIYG